MKRFAFAMLLGLLPFSAKAASPSLLGVTLGQKVQLPDCPKGQSKLQDTALCLLYNDNRDPELAYLSVPFGKRPAYINDYYNNRLWFDAKGRVQSIELDVLSMRRELALRDLKAKFGNPDRDADGYAWELTGARLTYAPHRAYDGGQITLESLEGKKIRENFRPNKDEIPL